MECTHRDGGRRNRLGAALITLLVLLGACGSDDSSAGPAATTSAVASSEVSSEILAEFEPPEAPGYTMFLYRVEIPTGADLSTPA